MLQGVTVELDEGWSSASVADQSVSIRRAVDGADVVVNLARIEAASAAAAASVVQALPGVEVLASSDSRMSGLTGPNLELENTSTGQVRPLTTASGPIALESGQRMWLSMFDTADGVVAVSVIADASVWDAALLAAERVLETVKID